MPEHIAAWQQGGSGENPCLSSGRLTDRLVQRPWAAGPWRGVAVGPAPLCPAARSALPRASARSAPGSDPAPPAVLARKAVTGRLGEAAVSQPWQTGCFEGCVVTAVLLTLLFQERAIVKILHVILKEWTVNFFLNWADIQKPDCSVWTPDFTGWKLLCLGRKPDPMGILQAKQWSCWWL